MVTVNEVPDFNLGNNQLICEGDTTMLDATAATCNSCAYLWNDMSTNPAREVSPLFNTTYTIVVTDMDNMCTREEDVTVNVSPRSEVRVNDLTCDPTEVRNDTIISTNRSMDLGRDTLIGANIFGCDSLNIITFFLLPSSLENRTGGTCDTAEVGIDTMILVNEFGCDSIIIIDTMIFVNEFGCDSVIINITERILSDTIRLDEPVCIDDEVRLDTLILTNDVGCDSLIITNFIKNDTIFIQNIFGCDSLVVEIVNLAPSSEEDAFIMTCDINQVSRDTIFETNIFGCDSIVYQFFEILRSDTTMLTDYVCDSPAFIDTSFMINSIGCDSMIITMFEEASSDEVFLDGFTCDENQVGIQVFNLTNQFGCDSTVTIDFALVDMQITMLEQNTCNPAQFMPDTLVFSTALCDSLVIISYNVQQESETILPLVSCDMNDVGTSTRTLSNQFGCDSTVVSIVEFAEQDITNLIEFECGLMETLVTETMFINQFGCDSLVILTTLPGLDTTLVS